MGHALRRPGLVIDSGQPCHPVLHFTQQCPGGRDDLVAIHGDLVLPPSSGQPPRSGPIQYRLPTASQSDTHRHPVIPLHLERRSIGWNQGGRRRRRTSRPWRLFGVRSGLLSPPMPLHAIGCGTTSPRSGTQDSFGTHQALHARQSPLCFDRGDGIFEKAKLATPSRHIGRREAEPNDATVHPSRVDPCTKLPPHTFSEHLFGEGVRASPHTKTPLSLFRHRLDLDSMSGRSDLTKVVDELMSQGSSCEPHSIEGVERLFVVLRDRNVLRNHPRRSLGSLTGGQSMSLQSQISEPRGHRGARQLRERPQRGDPQPPERCCDIPVPEDRDVLSGQKGGIVVHHHQPARLGGHGCQSSGKRPVGYSKPGSIVVELLTHQLEKLRFPSIEPKSTRYLHQNEPRLNDVHPWHEVFDASYHLLECVCLPPAITLEYDSARTQCLTFTTSHARTCPCLSGALIDGDHVKPINDQTGFNRWRVRSAKRPILPPDTQNSSHRPLLRSGARSPLRPSRMLGP